MCQQVVCSGTMLGSTLLLAMKCITLVRVFSYNVECGARVLWDLFYQQQHCYTYMVLVLVWGELLLG